MSQLKLRGVTFQELAHPFTEPRASISEVFQKIAGTLGPHMRKMAELVPAAERSQIAGHFLCSTIVNACFTTEDIRWEEVSGYFRQQVPDAPPTMMLNAYECASWGYALRYHFKQNPEARYYLVSILDVNVYNYEFWVWNENWEHSGFGATTLLFERTGDLTTELVTGAAKGFNPMVEFATGIRRAMASPKRECTIAMPFFPEKIGTMLGNVLKSFDVLPDHHQRWGHSFGNDPWISILYSTPADKRTAPDANTYFACSLALNGYYVLAEVDVDSDTVMTLHELPEKVLG